ncbi:hypothetical protein A2154_01315 [Candidatus Gottesmanbacteria bacterium RBG_16_43_7]|uniref:Uncharacterized protein n=1 Tax=Candidatus Gottesmanbacteria bacterium RBG_16_43_7 TaxID=1798373 RepID=A0A1F5Z8H4_9BACT|nr:MAG: hypothetical protein A2154_01315 [Candidatus Gottesmanbacteria bacterium RBG_16_43_7]
MEVTLEVILLVVIGVLALISAIFLAINKAGGLGGILFVISLAFFATAVYSYDAESLTRQKEQLELTQAKAEIALIQAQVAETEADTALKIEFHTWLEGARWGLALKTLVEFAPVLLCTAIAFVLFLLLLLLVLTLVVRARTG